MVSDILYASVVHDLPAFDDLAIARAVSSVSSKSRVFSNPRMSLKGGKGRKPMGLLSEGLRNKV